MSYRKASNQEIATAIELQVVQTLEAAKGIRSPKALHRIINDALISAKSNARWLRANQEATNGSN